MGLELVKSIIYHVKIDNLIGMSLDGGFFLKDNKKPELYGGFVTELSDRVIGISTTPRTNLSHGKDVEKDENLKRGITKIELSSFIRNYFSIDTYAKPLSEGEIIHNICIGDFLMLYLDGQFYGRKDHLPELYAGFVSLIKPGFVGISTTHHENVRHGYVSRSRENEPDQKRLITGVPLGNVLQSRKIDYNTVNTIIE